MIRSMTGYGKAICETETKKITIEIRSLNSKQFDLNIRIPNVYREKEIEIRNEILNQLERGKIDLSMHVEQTSSDSNMSINKEAIIDYYKQVESLSKELNTDNNDGILPAILRFPDVLKNDREEIEETEWNSIFLDLRKAINDLIKFRDQEGQALKKDIEKRVNLIIELLSGIEKYESARIETIKHRILMNLGEFTEEEKYDKNRFEQEMIYYLEKFDITEEKVRLTNHCNYFIETSNSKQSVGKKLGFISQEIGREINTIGSKANDSDIQKLVVQMKDELEKIKEQLLNVL